MKLSIVVPVYNEENTIEEILRRVDSAIIETVAEREIIVVDDFSTDGTRIKLEGLARSRKDLKVLYHDKNRGKGAALRTGFMALTGDLVVIQDADLEYDPSEYGKLLGPIVDGIADVVYGSRFLGSPQGSIYFWHYRANKLLTLLSNTMNNINLTDMETCYKVFKSEVLRELTFRSNRFGFEPEFTAKITRRKHRIYEIPISYYGRTYKEGKKIGWRDGILAVFYIIWYRFFN
ncbi:MAG: glycosyltransferase family 2 protein [Deltaproteobacteria bacterium]|uniref:Glycosyltransferase family 2 protein n=1 Tax=Candidatus Zymogenus saltonus TaxID=2844893 RepID=A0A9D8KH57_9DELT|nr:glycosyltransferase family 2 protein [Candidatus Zymogenus saltonus]